MKPLKVSLTLATGLIVALSTIAITGSPSGKESRTPENFMKQKSLYSQAVLDALMKEQYDEIVIAGEGMKKMTRDTRWRQFGTDDYYRHSENFRIHAQAMVDSARAKNLDGAMDGYLKCLQTCYDCHKYVRLDRAHSALLKQSIR